MRRAAMWIGLGLVLSGCGGNAGHDAAPVFDAVLKHELPDAKKDVTLFLFVEGLDPSPELLQRLQETWPGAQAGSKVGKGRADRVNFGELKWVGSDGAELQCTISNGMDGRQKQFKLKRKNGVWIVESAKTTAVS